MLPASPTCRRPSPELPAYAPRPAISWHQLSEGALASASFNVYGLGLRVSGEWDDVVEAVRLDYAWFEAPPGSLEPSVDVLVERGAPDRDAYGQAQAAFLTPRYAVFRHGGETVVDYPGAAVSVIEASGEAMRIRGEREDVVHEAIYYFLLGSIGRHLDSKGLVRVHGLGLAGDGGAALVLLPSGGGKSTLAMQALKGGGRLLSEDSPVLDRAGRVHPFPLRIAASVADAPEGRRLHQVAFDPKVAVEVSAFADLVEPVPQPLKYIVLGRRSLARTAQLEEVSRAAGVLPLIQNVVVGVGLYQGLGYAHQRGGRELLAKLAVAGGRAWTCAAGLRGAQVWRLTLGRDHAQNWETLRSLIG